VHGKEKRGHGEGEGYTIGSTERFVVSASASWQTDDDGGGLEKEKATGELGFLKLKGKMEGKRNLRMRQGSVKLQGMLATVTELLGDAIRRGSELTREESGRGDKKGLSGGFIGRVEAVRAGVNS
jgi:hypothetical protein